MKILHVHNLMLRHYGNFKFYTGYKLSNGIVRNNHRLLEFSDRDMVRYEAPMGIRILGKKKANRRLIEACLNFQPDLILIGHCDLISEKTLLEIRRLLPSTKIAHWFLDALWIDRNLQRLKKRMHCTDSIFITTGGESIKQFCTGKNLVSFIPNPTDLAWEQHDNSKREQFERDLVFCGVGSKSDYRYQLLKNLEVTIKHQLNFETFGIRGNPAVWGERYDCVIGGSKMALNLNREEGWAYYSSDRISQLLGNGLLTFVWDKGEMRRLFDDEYVVFFKDEDELCEKVKYFHSHDDHRKSIASAGRAYYHRYFSAEKVVKYIVESTFEIPLSEDYPWADQLYR